MVSAFADRSVLRAAYAHIRQQCDYCAVMTSLVGRRALTLPRLNSAEMPAAQDGVYGVKILGYGMSGCIFGSGFITYALIGFFGVTCSSDAHPYLRVHVHTHKLDMRVRCI